MPVNVNNYSDSDSENSQDFSRIGDLQFSNTYLLISDQNIETTVKHRILDKTNTLTEKILLKLIN